MNLSVSADALTPPLSRGGLGRPGHFALIAESFLWRKRAGLAYEVSDFWTKHFAERLLASIAGRCSF
jgi:hypothetical protein